MSKSISATRVERRMTDRERDLFGVQMCGKPFGAWHKPRRVVLSRRNIPEPPFKGKACSLPALDGPPSLAWLASTGQSRPCLNCGTGHKNGNAFCSRDCHREYGR